MSQQPPVTRAQVGALASDASLGRFAGQGSAQNDNFPYNDNVDAAHPAYVDYVLPKNFQRIVSAKLSFKLRLYRTYNSLALSATGGSSNSHNHGHSHTWAVQDGTGIPTANMVFGNSPIAVKNIGGTTGNVPTTTDTTGQSADHTHSVSGSATLGVTEGSATTVAAIAFDGVDQTAALGGPWTVDTVELDVTKFISLAISTWHTVTITPAGQGRIVSLLRASYYIDSRLSQ